MNALRTFFQAVRRFFRAIFRAFKAEFAGKAKGGGRRPAAGPRRSRNPWPICKAGQHRVPKLCPACGYCEGCHDTCEQCSRCTLACPGHREGDQK